MFTCPNDPPFFVYSDYPSAWTASDSTPCDTSAQVLNELLEYCEGYLGLADHSYNVQCDFSFLGYWTLREDSNAACTATAAALDILLERYYKGTVASASPGGDLALSCDTGVFFGDFNGLSSCLTSAATLNSVL